VDVDFDMSDATFGDTTDESDSAIGGVGSYAFVLFLLCLVKFPRFVCSRGEEYADGVTGLQRTRLGPVCWMRSWRRMGGHIMFTRMGVSFMLRWERDARANDGIEYMLPNDEVGFKLPSRKFRLADVKCRLS